ncbi:DNA repair protein REV1, partial [Eumeta japonica]
MYVLEWSARGAAGTRQEQTEKIIVLPGLAILAPPKVYALCMGTGGTALFTALILNYFLLHRQPLCQYTLSKSVGISKEILKSTEFTVRSRADDIIVEDDKYGSMSEIASCSYEARAKGIKNGMFMGTAIQLCPDLITIPYDFEGYKEVAYKLYNTVA